MKMSSIQFEIILGTYEEFVLGYQFLLDETIDKGELSQEFATHSHRASVRAVATHGKLVVSGGADETINIYNMFVRKECGMLMEHNGTITSLNFTPDGSHIISTSEDGSIKIFRQGSWQLEKVWANAHKGTAVTSLSVHPSGKMALSVGKDHTLRTWNLVKGRPAYTTNLYSRCRQLELVVWSPEGLLFAIPMDTKVEITNTQKAGVLHTLQLESKVTACIFLSEEVICVGEASGAVTAFDTGSGAQLWTLAGDERVRGLASLRGHMVTATSAGRVCVYAAPDLTKAPRLLASTDCGCRITCLALYDYKSEVKVKKENPEEEIKENKSLANCVKNKRKIPQDEDTPVLINVNTSHKKKKKNNSLEFDEINKVKTPDAQEKRDGTSKTKTPDTKAQEKRDRTSKAKTPDAKVQEKRKSQGSEIVVCSPRTQKWIVEDSKG